MTNSYLTSSELRPLSLPGRAILALGQTLTKERVRGDGDWYAIHDGTVKLTIVELPGGRHFDFFQAGWDAWRERRPKSYNPLHRASIGGYLWLRGWSAAQREGKRRGLV